VELNQVQVQVQVQGQGQSEVLQSGLLNAMDYNEVASTRLHFVIELKSHDGFNFNAEVKGFLNFAREQGLEVVPEIGGM
jgi:hypothetical protein